MASGLEGARELEKKLAKLGKKVGGRVLRKSLRAGIKPAKDRAKATIPVGKEAHKTYKGRIVLEGFSRRSVVTAVKMRRDGASGSALLGVKREAFYAALFVEFGVPAHGIAGRPWLVPALEETQQRSITIIGDELRKNIEQVAREKK